MYTEELVEMYPELSRVEREEAVLREHGAVLLIGIGTPLVSADGTPSPPHENRAVDYDDWLTPNGHTTAGAAAGGSMPTSSCGMMSPAAATS